MPPERKTMKQQLFTIAKGWHEYDQSGNSIGGTPLINGNGPKFSKIEHLKSYVKKAYGIQPDAINLGFAWTVEEKAEKTTIIYDYKITTITVNY